MRRFYWVATACLLCWALLAIAAAEDRKEEFETRIRPILAKNCYACHTQAKLGGLQLNSREGLLKGGKSGPAIVPGNPNDSLLIRALSYTHSELKMPPSGRLSDADLAAMTTWIRDGAIWPEPSLKPVAPAAAGGYIITPDQRSFWAFQPVRKPTPPAVKDTTWVRGEIDRFILSKLEEQSLKPSAEAGRRVWIRRATFDLIGIPPTPQEVAAFLNDRSPNAYEKVVDRLLASPHYGERWGRYWLDIARYSDDVLDTILGKAPSFYLYRDWVIRSLNEDMPYDLFLKAQIAADLLPVADKQKLLPGLTMFVDAPSDFADDDRVDVLTRGFLGMTVACAKCHDHKYDPIPTKDYYSLLGIFRSTQPRDLPLADTTTVSNYNLHAQAVARQAKELDEFLGTARQQIITILAADSSRYLMATWQVLGARKLDVARAAETAQLDREVLSRWVTYIKRSGKQHPFLKHWEELLNSGATEAQIKRESDAFQMIATQVIQQKSETDEFNNVLVFGARLGRDLNDVSGKTMPRDQYMLWQDLAAVGKPHASTARPEPRFDGVLMFPGDSILRFYPPTFAAHANRLRARLAELKSAMPAEYPYLSIVEESPKPANLHVFIRGNAQNLGPEAPRAFLTVLQDLFPEPFTKGSGRLQLAEAVASPRNPLTARVMVNRVWEKHFGYGLVRSPSNFGQTGERPVLPELLDYLASRLMEQGWSLKKLHREILLSATYRLSTDRSEAAMGKDPDDRYHWRYPVRRLDAEALRDSILAVSGSLDRSMGGKSVDLAEPSNYRRTVYGKISRNVLDPMLTLFDFPNPNATSEQRLPTTVPLQRLFLLNSPLVMNQSHSIIKRLETTGVTAPPERVRTLYQWLFQRDPSAAEAKAALEFIEHDGADAWVHYAQVLLASNEFLYGE